MLTTSINGVGQTTPNFYDSDGAIGLYYDVANKSARGKQGLHWLFYNLLVASMAVVLASANGLLFLMAWEIMSMSSFFLVLDRYQEKESREAAWIYLIATHIGTAFLILFFLLASSQTGSMDF